MSVNIKTSFFKTTDSIYYFGKIKLSYMFVFCFQFIQIPAINCSWIGLCRWGLLFLFICISMYKSSTEQNSVEDSGGQHPAGYAYINDDDVFTKQ